MIESLFYRSALVDHLHERRARVSELMAQVCEQQLQANSDDDIRQHIAGQLLLQPLTIFRDNIQHSWTQKTVGLIDDRDTLVFSPREGVAGVEIRVEIPYAGSVELWHLTSSQHRLSFPMGEPWPSRDDPSVGLLCLEYSLPLAQVEQEAKQRFEQDLDDIERHITAQAAEIAVFKRQLLGDIDQLLQRKRQHLNVVQKIPELLGIPLKRNQQSPDWPEHWPREKTAVKVKPLRASVAAEPELLDEQYAHMLNVIRLEGMSFERSPATFQQFSEESLRDIILAHLNGHYEGAATGETFNKGGKTDIHIPVDGRSAFVAECKLWKGPKSLLSAIDQLQGYLTWRDCRAAVVVFNKQVAGFSRILQDIPLCLREHSDIIQLQHTELENEWQLVLRASEDAQRHIHVRVMVFNLYTPS